MYSFAVYNKKLKKTVMVVIDAMDKNDPSWNPPNCVKVFFRKHKDYTEVYETKFAFVSYMENRVNRYMARK